MEIEQHTHSRAESSSSVTFERASFVALIVTIILGFLAFMPMSFLPLAVVKTFVIVVGALVSAIFFILSKIKARHITLSSHPLVWIGAGTALVILLSSLLSPNIVGSFFGKSFAADTACFLLVLFVSGVLSFALTKKNDNRTFFVFSAILGSFSLLAIFHIVRFFLGAGFLSFGTFTSVVYTSVGSWHDMGIFAGLSLIISLVTLQLLPITNRIARAFFIAAFLLAAIILVVVDLQSVWTVVALVTFVFSIYGYILNQRKLKSESRTKRTSGIPMLSVLVTIVAFVLAWNPSVIGTFVGSHIVTKAGAAYTEINLPWGLTMDIAEPTIKSSPFLGAGPGRFASQYLLYKPEVINATPFWSSSFSNGAGFVLTSLATEGILGFLLWIAIIVTFVFFGARALFRGTEESDPFTRYGAATSYFGGGFLVVSLIGYMPQHAILFILFVISGIFIAQTVSTSGKRINFSGGLMKILSMIVLWILIAVSALLIIIYVKNTIAEAYFQSAAQSLNNGGSINDSAQKIQTALKLNKSDVYYQAISRMDLYAVNQIVSTATTTLSQDSTQLISNLINDGINSARLAQKFDSTNPYNYLAQAQVDATAAGLGVQGAYADATSSYQTALTLDPLDPSIYLEMAKLEFFEKNDTTAKNFLNAALQLKPDYADALFEAGVISYADKDYATALQAFTQVQKIQSDYPNIQADINLVKSAQTGTSVQPTQSPSVSASTTLPAMMASTTAFQAIKAKK